MYAVRHRHFPSGKKRDAEQTYNSARHLLTLPVTEASEPHFPLPPPQGKTGAAHWHASGALQYGGQLCSAVPLNMGVGPGQPQDKTIQSQQ